MSSTRKFVYAALLGLSMLNFIPASASAQESVQGKFTLTHGVHWQNAVVPAGDYGFTLDSDGVGGVLKLSKLNGAAGGYFFLAQEMEAAKPGELSELVLSSSALGSYVTAMQLPEFGMTLHFASPSTHEKEIAAAGTTALASGQ
jgi:hypothetical protein